MLQFRKGSWSQDKITSCREELNKVFFEAVGMGEKRMNPHAVTKIDAIKVELAETIVNLVEQEVRLVDPLPFLVDEVEGDIRNSYVWQELDSSLRVVSRAYGSKPLSQRLTFKEYGMSTSMSETAVEIPLEEVFSGRQTPALAASEMALAISRRRISNTLDLLDAGVPASTADRTGISGYTLRYVESTNLTQTNLNKALDGLQDEGLGATVLARHVAFAPAVRGFTGFSNEVEDEMTRRGVIGQYHGATFVALTDPHVKRSADHTIRKDRIYIAGSQKGAIYMVKPVQFLNWALTDPRTATFSTGIRIEDGVLVWDAYRYRIIEVNPT
jgi:hypothetical protein